MAIKFNIHNCFLQKIIALINEYFDNKIMSPKWTPKSLNIAIPNSSNFEEYQSILMKIDSNDTKPEIFGLSPASSVSRNITFCRNLLKNLRKIYFNIDESENYEKRVRPLMSLWKKFSSVSGNVKFSSECN